MRYFTITFQDLSFEKQQELIGEIKKDILARYQEMGESILHDDRRNWYVTPRTWQEAYGREFAVDHQMWNDLEETSKEFREFDWKQSIDELAEREAEDKLTKAFHRTEVGV